MARTHALDPQLRNWINRSVCPHLSHDRACGWPARIHRGGADFGDPLRRLPQVPPARRVGKCYLCSTVIGWFGFIRFNAASEAEAIECIAAMAGVSALRRINPFRRGAEVPGAPSQDGAAGNLGSSAVGQAGPAKVNN